MSFLLLTFYCLYDSREAVCIYTKFMGFINLKILKGENYEET